MDQAHKQGFTPTSPTNVSIKVHTIAEEEPEEEEEKEEDKKPLPNSLSLEEKNSERNLYTFTGEQSPSGDGFKTNLLGIRP